MRILIGGFWRHFLFHVYKRPPQSTSFHFPKKDLRVFLMEYLSWLETTVEWSSWGTVVEESRAKWQWKASGVVTAAVSQCHVLKGTSAIFFSIEESSTIRYKMNIWSLRDCIAKISGVFCAPIIVLSAGDMECRCPVTQLPSYVTQWKFYANEDRS